MVNRRLFVVFAVAAVLAWTSASPAALISYESGVLPQAGQSGAADPASQGFSWIGSGNAWSDAYDSGDGGWRIVDGTSTAPSFHQKTLSDPSQLSKPWVLSWTVSMDSDARNSGGGFVNDYYLPPNHARQSNQRVWLETVGGDTLLLAHRADSNGNLLIYDETTTHQITSDGTGYDNFKTLLVTHDGAGSYTLTHAGNSFNLSTAGIHGQNRLVFGASSSAAQGSLIWNRVSLTVVPEPSTLAIWALGLLALAAYGRRRQK